MKPSVLDQCFDDNVNSLITNIVAAQVQLLDRLRLQKAVLKGFDANHAHLILLEVEDLQVLFFFQGLTNGDSALSKDAVIIQAELSDVLLVLKHL